MAHFTKGIGLLASLPEGDTRDKRELEFQLAFAVPLIALHGFGSEQVEACATRARELIDKGADDRTRFLAYRFVWNSSLMRRPVPQAIALARTLMDLAQGGNDATQLAIAHRALGFSIQIAGRLAKAISSFQMALLFLTASRTASLRPMASTQGWCAAPTGRKLAV